ncbi:uncharacterized protein [Spinacia oleracea]|uniref:Uncharacterized protein n=1 Tax=Spinacia oleracea TaxID=3562 RepID=A0ABM3RBU3_SPIOL|nr:uncharacterized protein LOC110777091 [Spinacia oleracea]
MQFKWVMRDLEIASSPCPSGHLNKAGGFPCVIFRSFVFTPSQKLLFEELFKEGDMVDVSGTTIGKGFQDTDSVSEIEMGDENLIPPPTPRLTDYSKPSLSVLPKAIMPSITCIY